MAAGDLQVLDAEGVPIDIRCGAEQLRFFDDDAVVLIDGIQGEVGGDRSVINRGDGEVGRALDGFFWLIAINKNIVYPPGFIIG